MSRGRRKRFYFGNKENFEEFRERVYEAVRHSRQRHPYNKFHPDYKDAVEKEDKDGGNDK
jgi:GTP-binding protein HflX